MKTKIKVALCLILTLFALMSLAAVLGSLGMIPAAAASDAYMLREYDGCVAVYYPAQADTPTTVTGIRVCGLPLPDRLALKSGVAASDYDAVVRLLEDYGA